MSVIDFERLYRQDPDPWGYTTSSYERDKYAATLDACGRGPFANALELGASIGVFTALLAPRCRKLTTVDAAPTAVHLARRRLQGMAQVELVCGEIPEAIPDDGYDLVVASEILYYLTSATLDATLATLHQVLEPGGRLVAVHWRPPGPERPLTAAQAHLRLRQQPWLRAQTQSGTSEYMLDVMERT
jgi:SAM-dependent methyltransferase